VEEAVAGQLDEGLTQFSVCPYLQHKAQQRLEKMSASGTIETSLFYRDI